MNKSVDPCEDFYTYACGGWQRRHSVTYNASSSTTRWNMLRNNIWFLRKALRWAHLIYPKNDAVMKTVRVYDSCLNTTAIDALGLQPLKDLIKEYGGWTISQNYDPNVTVAQRIGRAARELNVDSLFGMDVRTNPYDSSINMLMLKESTLGLNKRDYLGLDGNSEKKRKDYKNYMRAVSQMFSISYAKMEAVYDFEAKLAKISSGKNLDVALADYIKITAKQARTRKKKLEDKTIELYVFCQRTGFPWPVFKEFLDILFDRRLTGNEKILPISHHIAFLKEMGILYNKINHSLLADYIMWQVVRKYIGALPDQYRPLKQFDLLRSNSLPRGQQCIYAMLKPFDMPLGLLFVDAHFNDEARVKITEMIENFRTSFIEKLPSLTRMDKETREKAKQKGTCKNEDDCFAYNLFMKIIQQTQTTWMDKETHDMVKQKALAIAFEDIGYPTYIKDPAKLKAQYDSLSVTYSLMDNLKAANHFLRMRTLKKFEQPADKEEWPLGPASVNGYYDPSSNRIILFAGILQEPFYSPDYPRYINYGAIGGIIGHEIIHAFDGDGRLYDENGNFNDGWSAPSAANFESKSKCFVKQYNKYKIFDKFANGTLTLNENIADNGGIKLAYDAYQRWTNGTEKILPGLDLNPSQLFFLGFAQPWCSVYSKEGAYNQLETDVHSTAKYRIIGSLSNFRKFSEVFRCSPNSGMNPVDKCEIW